MPQPPTPFVLGTVGCITSFATLREVRANPARVIRMTNRWATAYTPEVLVINMRPGLPCWLGWAALHQRSKPRNADLWKIVAVAAANQIEKAPSDVVDLLTELWVRADERIVVTSVFDRDETVKSRTQSNLVNLGNIMDLSAP